MYDFKYGLSACFDCRADHTAICDCMCGLSGGHDFRFDLSITYGLSQCMILWIVLTTSYDYR